MPLLITGSPADGTETIPDSLVVSRKIDPRSKDYVRDSDGIADSADSVSMRVLLAIGNNKGDVGFDPEFGDASNSFDRNVEGLQGKAFRAAQLALKDLLDAGEIQLLGVDVRAEQGRFYRIVRWRKAGETRPRSTEI